MQTRTTVRYKRTFKFMFHNLDNLIFHLLLSTELGGYTITSFKTERKQKLCLQLHKLEFEPTCKQSTWQNEPLLIHK